MSDIKDITLLQQAEMEERARQCTREVIDYLADLRADAYIDRWEEWTAKMDDINNAMSRLYSIVAVMEAQAKNRMLRKKGFDDPCEFFFRPSSDN